MSRSAAIHNGGHSRGLLVRLFSFAVLDQALLSAANFGVGLLLIRYSTDLQYGYYVMAFAAVLLAGTVQNAVLSGPMAVLAPKLALAAQQNLIERLHELLARAALPLGAMVAAVFLLLGAMKLIDWSLAWVGCATGAASAAVIEREYLRRVLLVRSMPDRLLQIDFVFVVLQLLVVVLAVTQLLEHAALVSITGIGVAAFLSSTLSRQYARSRPAVAVAVGARSQAFVRAWRLGKWGLLGAVMTWMHNQGFYYLLAALLSVEAVALIATVRLLLMPINLLITGVSQQLLPVAARWLAESGLRTLLRRGGLIAVGLLLLSVTYVAMLWWPREWIMVHVFRRQVIGMDPLLLLWAATFCVMAVRHAATVMLQAMELHRALVWAAAVSALCSLLSGFVGIHQLGAMGGLLGLVVGESVYLLVNLGLMWRGLRLSER